MTTKSDLWHSKRLAFCSTWETGHCSKGLELTQYLENWMASQHSNSILRESALVTIYCDSVTRTFAIIKMTIIVIIIIYWHHRLFFSHSQPSLWFGTQFYNCSFVAY